MPPEESKPEKGQGKQWKDETVAESVDEAKFHIEFEKDRLQGQYLRAGWLIALDGVLLALAAGQAHELLNQTGRLGNVGRWIAAVALMVAAIGVFASAVLSLRGILLKSQAWQWDLVEIRDLAETETVLQDRAWVQGKFLRGLIEHIAIARCSYQEVRRWVMRGYVALVIALLAAVVYVGVYSERAIENPCTAASRSSAEHASSFTSNAPGVVQVRSGLSAFASTRSSPVDSPFPKPKGGVCGGA
jgi:hypothetical protein